LHKDSYFDRNAEIAESLCFHCRDSYKTLKFCEATVVRNMNRPNDPSLRDIVTFQYIFFSRHSCVIAVVISSKKLLNAKAIMIKALLCKHRLKDDQ